MSCLNPIFIERRRSLLGAKHVSERLSRIYGMPIQSATSGSFVPCGKCSACLKRRQNDLAARCSAEAQRCGSMVFVTLTYDEEHLPLAVRLEHVDKTTGEVTYDYELKQLRRRDRYDVDSDWTLEVLDSVCRAGRVPYRSITRDVVDIEDSLYRVTITPSLCNRDVRLWLKRARVSYERVFRSKLPEFKYVVCGEYGNNDTKRPHYHLAFFGLHKEHVDFMVSLWQYGFKYVQWVNSINFDGTDGFSIAAKYIGKYMTKGKFDCQSVYDGFAFKSRICASKHLGGQLSLPLVSYFRCYDLIGEYDIDTPLSKDKLDILLRELPKRSSITIGKSVFVLPNTFKKQLWYVKDFDKVYRSSVVRMQIADALSSDSVHEYYSKLKKDYPDLSEGEISALVAKFKTEQKACFDLQNERGMFHLEKFYLSSKF